MNEEDINIDDEWISEFNEEERNYSKFYKEPNTFISLQFIYINSKKEIECVTQIKQQLDKENILLSTTLNNIILERNHLNATSFRLYKLLLYKTMCDPEEIISNSTKFTNNLDEITEITDILLSDTINYFKSLNTLFFIFVEDKPITIVSSQTNQKPNNFSLNKGSRRHKRHS